MNRGFVARSSIDVNATAERLWTALTDPASIKQYFFGTTLDSSWRVGSPITWKGEWQGKQYEDRGVILTFDAPRTLAYTHFSPLTGQPDTPENYHTVTITLSPSGKGTRVTLQQDNNATEEERAHSEKNWEMVLSGLKTFVEHGA
jgi:uncharacterized protein YndB with AHSA1/START domain